jgi:hypothetical protein
MAHYCGRFKIAAFLLLVAGTARPQSVDELQQKLQAEFARVQKLPPEDQVIALTEFTASMILDGVWPKVIQVNRVSPNTAKPRIKAIFSDTRQAPFVDGQDVVFPSLYYELLSEFALLAGHDFYLDHEAYLPVPNPLVNAPYGSSAIFPLLEQPVYYLQNDFFASMRPLLTCSSKTPNCARAQQAALGCSIVFVLGHELAHHFAGHGDRGGDEYPIDEELFADDRGMALVKAFEPDLLVQNDGAAAVTDRSCYGSIAMMLEFEGDTKSDPLKTALLQRKDKVLAGLGDDIRDDVVEEITPERSDKNVGALEIASDRAPDLLIIDGAAIPHGAAIGASLLLPSGTHLIFAAKDNQYALHSVRISNGPPRKLNLAYRLLSAQPSEAEIGTLRKSRDWDALLLGTSDGHLHARSADVAYAHAEAMHALKLAEWIDLNDLRSASDAQRRRVESWVRTSQPLSDWR